MAPCVAEDVPPRRPRPSVLLGRDTVQLHSSQSPGERLLWAPEGDRAPAAARRPSELPRVAVRPTPTHGPWTSEGARGLWLASLGSDPRPPEPRVGGHRSRDRDGEARAVWGAGGGTGHMLKAPPPRRRGRASSVCSCVRMTGVAQGQGRLVGHRGVNQEAGAVSVAESGGWWSSLLGLSMGSCDLGPGPEATQLSGLGGWGAGVAPGCGRHGQEAGPPGAGRGGVTGCPGKHSIPWRGAGRVGAAPGAGWGGGVFCLPSEVPEC